MVAHCLQQLFEGKTLTEKTLIELERWAEQYPYHLSPTLIRLWNDRLEGSLDYDESQLNRLAFFMADRRQLFALVKGEGIPADNETVTLAKKETELRAMQSRLNRKTDPLFQALTWKSL